MKKLKDHYQVKIPNNMSKNFNRAKYNKAQRGVDIRKYKVMDLYPPYWDDGILFYPKYRRGYKNPNKVLFNYQVRMYKTWKYNRKTQFK